VSGSIAYRLDVGRRLFLRAFAGGGAALVHFDVAVGDRTHVVFRTPAAYVRAGIEAGFVFR
jgi:hypothetical protein